MSQTQEFDPEGREKVHRKKVLRLSPEFQKIVEAASLRVDLRERMADLTIDEAKQALKFIEDLRTKRH